MSTPGTLLGPEHVPRVHRDEVVLVSCFPSDILLSGGIRTKDLEKPVTFSPCLGNMPDLAGQPPKTPHRGMPWHCCQLILLKDLPGGKLGTNDVSLALDFRPA